MPKKPALWSQYQEDAAEFFRTLGMEATTNVKLEGIRTKHDVDVLVKSRHAGFDVTWVVECKRWNTRVSKLHVLALRTIVLETGSDRGILLAEKGAQSGAYEAAKLTNIHITTLHGAKNETKNEIYQMKLAELTERNEIARVRYWWLPKSTRIDYRLRADTFEHNYSGDTVTTVCRDILQVAKRGVFPIPINPMQKAAFKVPPSEIKTVEEAIAVATQLLEELEIKLNACYEATGFSEPDPTYTAPM